MKDAPTSHLDVSADQDPAGRSISSFAGDKSTEKKRVGRPKNPSPTTNLASLRDSKGLTQKEMALLMGIKQANVSRMESRGDILISSAKKYIEQLGGELKIVAQIGGEFYTLDLVNTLGTKKPRKSKINKEYE